MGQTACLSRDRDDHSFEEAPSIEEENIYTLREDLDKMQAFTDRLLGEMSRLRHEKEVLLAACNDLADENQNLREGNQDKMARASSLPSFRPSSSYQTYGVQNDRVNTSGIHDYAKNFSRHSSPGVSVKVLAPTPRDGYSCPASGSSSGKPPRLPVLPSQQGPPTKVPSAQPSPRQEANWPTLSFSPRLGFDSSAQQGVESYLIMTPAPAEDSRPKQVESFMIGSPTVPPPGWQRSVAIHGA